MYIIQLNGNCRSEAACMSGIEEFKQPAPEKSGSFF